MQQNRHRLHEPGAPPTHNDWPLEGDLAGFALSAQARADEPIYFLPKAQDLSCRKDHAADYAPTGDGTSFITVADCGSDTAGSGGLLDQVLNSAPDIDIVNGEGADPVLSVREVTGDSAIGAEMAVFAEGCPATAEAG